MGFFVKQDSATWKNVKNFFVKQNSSTWKPILKAYVKNGARWIQFWPKSGPYATTSPYISSDIAGNNFFTIGDPIYSYAVDGVTATDIYGQIGVWDANVPLTLSQTLTYTYEVDSSASSDTLVFGGFRTEIVGSSSNILSYLAPGAKDYSLYAKFNVTNSNFDGRYLIFIVYATNVSKITGDDSSDSSGSRYLVSKRNPEPYSIAPSIFLDTVTSQTEYSFIYTSYWNGKPGYTPDKTRSNVLWYSSKNGSYSTVDQIKANATPLIGGITTTTPVTTNNVYKVTSTFTQTISTIEDGTYFYAVDTQENSYTDFSQSKVTQFAKSLKTNQVPGAINPSYTSLKYNSVRITWSAPTNNGTAIDYYQYRVISAQADTGYLNQDVSGNLYQDLGLSPNTSYSVFVRAHNSGGYGLEGTAVSFTTPDSPHIANISSMTFNQSNEALTVTGINYPDGKVPYSYQLQWAPYQGSWTNINGVILESDRSKYGTTTVFNYSSSQVPEGKYYYRFTTYGTDGSSIVSSSTYGPFNTYRVPGTPSNLSSVPSFTTATVSWTAPSTKSSPIDYYEYQISPVPQGGQSGFISTGNTSTSINFSGLSLGTTYTVSVRAHNDGGSGSSASTSFTTLVYVAPGAVNASASNVSYTTATVSWSAPSAGTSAIDEYQYAINGSGWVTNGTSTSVNFTGLTPNTAYSVQVRAHNNTGGYGISGTAASFTTLAYVAPGTPSPTVSNLTYTTATVSWAAPSAGTSSIDLYEYNVNGTGWNSNGTNLSVNLTLSPGINYVVQVRAHNNTGGYGSAGSTGTFTTPSYVAPGAVNANASNVSYTTATVSWSAPTAGSSAIDEYQYAINGSGWVTNGTSTSVNFTGLTPNTAYSVQVRAHNNTGGYGISGTAASFTTLAYVAPGTPSPTVSNLTYTSATVSWAAPTAGTSAIDLYEYQVNGTGWNSNGTSLSVNLTLSANTSYTIQVRAHNNTGGYGSAGGVSFTTPAYTVPGTPVPSASNITSTTAKVSWQAVTDGGSTVTYTYSITGGSIGGTDSYTNSGIVLSGTTYSVNFTLPNSNTTFTVKVKATNSSGSSIGQTSFTTLAAGTTAAPTTTTTTAAPVTTTTTAAPATTTTTTAASNPGYRCTSADVAMGCPTTSYCSGCGSGAGCATINTSWCGG